MEASRTIPRADPSAPITGTGGYSTGSPSPEPPSDQQTYGGPPAAAAAVAGGGGGDASGPSGRSFSRPGSVLGSAAANAAGSGGVSARAALSARAGGPGPQQPPQQQSRQRPDSAASEIALVCDASNALRAQTRSSIRRLMSRGNSGGLAASRTASVSGLPADSGGGAEGGGQLRPCSTALAGVPERPMSGVRRPVALTAGPDGLQEVYSSGEEGGEGEEEEEEAKLSSSESSGDHASDTEVPVALWLADFNAARQNKLFGAGAAVVGGGAGGSGGGGREAGGGGGGGGGGSKYNTGNWVTGYRNLKVGGWVQVVCWRLLGGAQGPGTGLWVLEVSAPGLGYEGRVARAPSRRHAVWCGLMSCNQSNAHSIGVPNTRPGSSRAGTQLNTPTCCSFHRRSHRSVRCRRYRSGPPPHTCPAGTEWPRRPECSRARRTAARRGDPARRHPPLRGEARSCGGSAGGACCQVWWARAPRRGRGRLLCGRNLWCAAACGGLRPAVMCTVMCLACLGGAHAAS